MSDNAPTNDSPLFMRSYRNAVDAQWRVTVPAQWRFAERADLFIRVKADHLVVITRADVERFRRKTDLLEGPDRTALLRAWADTTDKTQIDSAGRITLPKDWAQKVGIKSGTKVTMVGATENFQIWADQQHEDDASGMQTRGYALLAQYD